IVPGHGPMTSRSSARSERTSSLAHASPIAVATGWRSRASMSALGSPSAAATTAATGSSATAAAAAAAAAGTSLRPLPGDVHAQGAPEELLPVQLGDRLLGRIRARHLDEREASRSTADVVEHERYGGDLSTRGELFLDQVLGRLEGEVPHIKAIRHISRSSCRLGMNDSYRPNGGETPRSLCASLAPFLRERAHV